MPHGIRPRVNEAREFLEIAKDFKDPKEIIREALSNCWDAGATEVSILFDLVPISGSRRRKIRVTIQDNGEGMSSAPRPDVGSSEIEGFFNLGDSAKKEGSIGSKGHGTKIFYKSRGVVVDTWKNGQHIHAETETDPWAALQQGIVPTFGYDEKLDNTGRGARIVVDGFEAKQSDFASLEELIRYINWYTVVGSFGYAFGQSRTMNVTLRPAGTGTPITVPFGFRFPDESPDLQNGSESVCKIFGPDTINAGVTSDGRSVSIEIIGALLGEGNRAIVPHTYEQMGLWLSKDFIRIERKNPLLEDAFGGCNRSGANAGERSAAPGAQNRHGGAPRGERPASWDARRLASAWHAASWHAARVPLHPNVSRRSAHPSIRVGEAKLQNPGRKKRAAGTRVAV
jgi:hypothetical protein